MKMSQYIPTAVIILAAVLLQGHYQINMPMYGYAVIAVCILIAGCVWLYNNLVSQKNTIDNSFAAIDVMLKKRYDLIPNLVTLVKKHMEHEQETLTQITALRAQALKSDNMQEKMGLNTQISAQIQGILLSVENYPELQSSEHMLQLQQTLTEVEGYIGAARRTYNQNVTYYNNSCAQFPSNIVAALFGHKAQVMLDIPDSQRDVVDVGNLFKKSKCSL